MMMIFLTQTMEHTECLFIGCNWRQPLARQGGASAGRIYQRVKLVSSFLYIDMKMMVKLKQIAIYV